jgi:hypothetical protein
MEIRKPALDIDEMFDVIVAFRSLGYAIYNLDENSLVLRKLLPEGQFYDKKHNGLMVYINQKENTAEKYSFFYLYKVKVIKEWKEYHEPFTTKELKILDLQDYTLSEKQIEDTKQDVTDWIKDNEI